MRWSPAFSLGLAWAYEADFFAMFFAAAAAIAGVEAVRRIKSSGARGDTASPALNHSLVGDQRTKFPSGSHAYPARRNSSNKNSAPVSAEDRNPTDRISSERIDSTVRCLRRKVPGAANATAIPPPSLDQLRFAQALQLPPNFDPRREDIHRLSSIAILLNARCRRRLTYSNFAFQRSPFREGGERLSFWVSKVLGQRNIGLFVVKFQRLRPRRERSP